MTSRQRLRRRPILKAPPFEPARVSDEDGLQEAFSLALRRGLAGQVIELVGSFTISTPIEMPSSLAGLVLTSTARPVITAAASMTHMVRLNADRQELRHFDLDENTNVTTRLVDVAAVNKCRVRDLELTLDTSGVVGIEATASTVYAVVTGNHIGLDTTSAVGVKGDFSLARLQNNWIRVGGLGIEVTAGSSNVITGNYARDGIDDSASSGGSIIDGNIVQGGTGVNADASTTVGDNEL